MATTATNHWKLGLFVLLAVVALLGALFWLGARRFHRESFAAVSYFDESVQGLDVGSPVKFRGVTVGTVAEITIAPDRRHVQVTSNIYLDALVRLGLRTRAPRSDEEFIDPRVRVQLRQFRLMAAHLETSADRDRRENRYQQPEAAHHKDADRRHKVV